MTTIEVVERWRALQELMLVLPIEDFKQIRGHIIAIEKYLMRELERSNEQ